MSSEHALLIVDPDAPAQVAAVRVELLADVPIEHHETGRIRLLPRGRFVVIEAAEMERAMETGAR